MMLNWLILMLSVLLYSYPDGWSDDILLTPEDDKPRIDPDLDVDSYNHIWVVWDSANLMGSAAEVLLSKRDSNGVCLIPETSISNNLYYSSDPCIGIDGSNNVQIIWRDLSPQGFGVWHSKLANDGSVIVPSHLAVNGAGGGSSSLQPDLAINKDHELNIIWDEYISGYNQMNFSKMDSLGNVLIERIKVSPETIPAYWPGIAVDSFANIHLGYRTVSGGIQDCLTYSKLDRDGNQLVDNLILGIGYSPSLVISRNQNVHFVYPDPSSSGTAIKYLKLDNNGNIIDSALLSIHEENDQPHIAIDSIQFLHVVWSFYETPSWHGVMYTKLDTTGNTIIQPLPIIYPPFSLYPYQAKIGVDQSNRLHVVWMDQRLGCEDIFYKRGENDPGIKEENNTPLIPTVFISPNPFSIFTKINILNMTNDMNASITIYDATGNLIKVFNTDVQNSKLIWYGNDEQGKNVPCGVYFSIIKYSENIEVLKLIKVR